MTPELVALITPAIAVGGLLWRLSARLTIMDHKLDRLESENRQLRAELGALQALLAVLVDKRRPLP